MSEHQPDQEAPHADHRAPHPDEVWLRIKDHAGDSFEEHADRVRKAFEDARDGEDFNWTGYISDFWQQVAGDTTKAVRNTLDLWASYGTRERG